MAIKSYRDIEAWSLGIEMVANVYELTRELPKEEVYGLTSQLRRCAVSVPSNIAEGWGRESDRAFFHHLSIAQGSLAELGTQLEITVVLGYLERSIVDGTVSKVRAVRRKIRNLRARLIRDNPSLDPRK